MTAPITPEELLERAERDELLTVLDLERLLAAQHTPVERHTLWSWLRRQKIASRRMEGHSRDCVRIPGHEVLATLAWRRRVCRAA